MVDTSVWIDLFRGREARHVRMLERLLADGEDICICGVILMEILQGIRADSEHARTLSCMDVFPCLDIGRETFVKAAWIYRSLRRRGVTAGKPADCLIAAAAIAHGAALLHNDQDFEPIERYCGLKTMNSLPG